MANEYLQRTPTSTGNRKVWTWSGWFKLNDNTPTDGWAWLYNTSVNSGILINFDAPTYNSYVMFYDNGGSQQVISEASFRDPSSWYHLVVAYDSTSSTEGDRIKFFMNGVRLETHPSLSITYPTQNLESSWNRNIVHSIGRWESGTSRYIKAQYLDQYFIDGQALTPDVFGKYDEGKGYISAGTSQATDFKKGQWVPKAPAIIKSVINARGGFGVNGFYLPMNSANNYGADFHTTPNSILKLKENLPQPKAEIDGVGDYTGALRDDPFKDYLVLAIPFVSGGLQNGFGDYSYILKNSGSTKSPTVYGSSIVNTSTSPALYYGSSSYYRGTVTNPDYITFTSDDFIMGTGDWTIETWVKLPNVTPSNCWKSVVSIGDGYQTAGGITLYAPRYTAPVNTAVVILNQVNPTISGSSNINNDCWHHLCVEKYNGKTTLYVNGVAEGIVSDSNNYNQSTLYVGRDQNCVNNNPSNEGGRFTGYIQDLRVYKGVAKYKGGFDVPKPYTPVNFANWRAVPDTTANNFATINSLIKSQFTSGDRVLSDGNLTLSTISTGNGSCARSTIGVNSGKWYAEFYISSEINKTGTGFIGVTGIGRKDNQLSQTAGDHIYYYGANGTLFDYVDGSLTTRSYGSSYATGDIISILINADNGEVIYYKNGISQGVAKTFSSSLYPLFYQLEDGASSANMILNANFGQNPTFSGNTTAGTFTDSNGKGIFKYEPPEGFLALCEDNLPAPAIDDPGKHFKTVLWTGDGNNGRSITGVGFQPDLVWIKSRSPSAYNHRVFDSVRGPGKDNYLLPNLTSIEGSAADYYGGIGSFNSDGFSMVYGSGGTNIGINESGTTFVGWCWKAGGEAFTNTDGTITSQVSVNQDAGFSIVSWTGTGTNGSTIGHGLNKSPNFIISKSREGTSNWVVLTDSIDGSWDYLYLNLTNSKGDYTGTVTDSVINLYGTSNFNRTGEKTITYCWAEIEGYSKFGSYVGNDSTDGPFVYCGFKPAFVLLKAASTTGNWCMTDNARNPTNPTYYFAVANAANAGDDTGGLIDFVSNGFKLRLQSPNFNGNGVTYIFAAFAESPFQTANAK